MGTARDLERKAVRLGPESQVERGSLCVGGMIGLLTRPNALGGGPRNRSPPGDRA